MFDGVRPHMVLLKVKKAYCLTNGDTRVGKHAELWKMHRVFMLSFCGFYLCVARRKRVSVWLIRFDCSKRGGDPVLVCGNC